MKTRAELVELAAAAKAKADEQRLEYGEKYAGKPDLSEADDKVATELRESIAKLIKDEERFTAESLLAPLSEPEQKHQKEEVERDAFLRFLSKGWGGVGEDERTGYEAKFANGEPGDFLLFAPVAGNPRLDRGRPADPPTGVFPVITETVVSDALKYYGGIRQVASVLAVANGNPHRVPRHDSTSEEGVRIATENTQAAVLDYPDFGDTLIEPFTYTSRKMVVSNEYLQDANVDVMARMVQQLMRRIARIQNKEFTVTPSGGSADKKPEGLLSGAAAGITAAAATRFTWEETLDLMNSMDYAYLMGSEGPEQGALGSTFEGRRGFMCHQNVLNFICKIKDGQGRPILPRADAANISDMLVKRLWGFPIVVNNDMPSALTTGEEVLLFGNFGEYRITDVMNSTRVRRLEGDTHGAANQVALVSFMRSTAKFVGQKDGVRKLTLA